MDGGYQRIVHAYKTTNTSYFFDKLRREGGMRFWFDAATSGGGSVSSVSRHEEVVSY